MWPPAAPLVRLIRPCLLRFDDGTARIGQMQLRYRRIVVVVHAHENRGAAKILVNPRLLFGPCQPPSQGRWAAFRGLPFTRFASASSSRMVRSSGA
jgi:hypothetical protein